MAVVMEMVPKAPAGAVKIRLMHPRSNERDYADTTFNVIQTSHHRLVRFCALRFTRSATSHPQIAGLKTYGIPKVQSTNSSMKSPSTIAHHCRLVSQRLVYITASVFFRFLDLYSAKLSPPILASSYVDNVICNKPRRQDSIADPFKTIQWQANASIRSGSSFFRPRHRRE